MAADLRQAVRSLGRNPLASTLVVAALALGMGAVCTVFSVLEAVLLRSLPFSDAHRLVAVWSSHSGQGVENGPVSMADFLDWRAAARGFAGLAVIQRGGFGLAVDGEPEEIVASLVTTDFFPLLGTSPALGRVPTAEEGVPGRDRVVVLSHGFWRRRFGAAPDIVGRTLLLDGEEHVVIGVMPRDFRFPHREVELWTPLSLDPAKRDRLLRGRRIFQAIGRLADGVTLEQAREEMTAIAAGLADEHPGTNGGWGVRLVPLREQMLGDARPALLLLLAASAAVLLIACANVATLMLARLTARRRELAVRVALGARGWALARPFTAEALLLVGVSTLLGLLLAHAALRAVVASGIDLPRLESARIGLPVILFAVAVSAVTLLMVVGPTALRAGRPAGSDPLRAGVTVAEGRLMGGLLALQVALAVGLLVGAGLLARSLAHLYEEDLGFQTEGLLVAHLRLPAARYSKPPEIAAFYHQLLDSLAAQPGARTVALTSAPPKSPVALEFNLPYRLEGRPKPETEAQVFVRIVSPEYFRALGIPLLRGRALTPRDRYGAPLTAIINQTFERQAWPDGGALGKALSLPFRGWKSYEVVGVVGDVRHEGLDREPQPEIYLAFGQSPLPGMNVVVRAVEDPLRLAGALKAEVRALDHQQPVAGITTMEEIVGNTLVQRRVNTFLVVLFAASAWFLAGVGIFGMAAVAAGRRMRDFGLRKALGAPPSAILSTATAPVLIWVAVGGSLGLLGAFASSRMLARFLFGISPLDPVTLLTALALLVAAALLGCLLPVQRALRTDPAVVLRSE